MKILLKRKIFKQENLYITLIKDNNFKLNRKQYKTKYK